MGDIQIPFATISSRGPKGYGVSLLLSRIIKVKQIFILDRILAQRLKEVATYRRLCGFSMAGCQRIAHTQPSE